MSFYDSYLARLAERAERGLPPLPLAMEQVASLVDELCDGNHVQQHDVFLSLLLHRVRPGLDPAAGVKARFLNDIATGVRSHPLFGPYQAVQALGSMKSGFAVDYLVELLAHPRLGSHALAELAGMVHLYDAFDRVCKLAADGLPAAGKLLVAWASESWLKVGAEVPMVTHGVAFYAPGVTTTEDLSPASEVATRTDVPLHAQAMFKFGKGDIQPDEVGKRGPLTLIDTLKARGAQVIFCGDLVGVGSSRASATNSLMWHFGVDIDGQPNKRRGGITLAGQFAPIFLNAQRDYGVLPLVADISGLALGDAITIDLRDQTLAVAGKGTRSLNLSDPESLHEVRAGGRLNYRLGKLLTAKALAYLDPTDEAKRATSPPLTEGGPFTLAQKMVGKAIGRAGVKPGDYCEPKVSTIAMPDDAGPVAAEELNDLGCSKFGVDLVVQSFCHTSAYPTPQDVQMHRTLGPFVSQRGGLSLRPGDGVIHTWVNQLLVPDQLGTGADSHTRFPLGISFPAASNLVAFAAATGVMPLTMPESVRVQFHGRLKPHLTVRDIVNFIPYVAEMQGLLSTAANERKNVFSGKVMEIHGLEWLSVDEAFEVCDSTAERTATAVTIQLDIEAVRQHLTAGAAVARDLLERQYGSRDAIVARLAAIEAWLKKPELLIADEDCQYAAVIDIDLDELDEPMLCVPNDPDTVKPLSEVAGVAVSNVFLGSCMTTKSSFTDAGKLLSGATQAPVQFWVAPPSRVLEETLNQDGTLDSLRRAGARLEPPGCSLCMGNQARVADAATVVSTSTRNYPNRMGNGAFVYLASARVAALTARLGHIPSFDDYLTAYPRIPDCASTET